MRADIGRIVELAKEQGVSHAHLARKIGKYRTVISEWRNKKATPTENDIRIIASELNTTISYLIGEEQTMTEKYLESANVRLLELEYITIDAIRTFEDICGAEPDGCRYDDPRFAGYIEERLKAAVEAEALQRAYATVTGKAYDTTAEYLHTMARARCPECGAYIDHEYNCCSGRNCDWTE
jgi:transcriptional regulator with XRE-family HTH domain